MHISGNSSIFINGQRIETRNGRTYVNGVEINGDNSGKSRKQSKVRIFSPEHADLDVDMRGEGVLASAIAINNADINVSGQSFVALAVRNLKFDLSGQSTSTLVIGGGELKISVSEQGMVKAQSTFSEVKADLSGMRNIVTSGTCKGNYKASVSGMGSVAHHGIVNGRIKKSVSGMGSINVH